VRAGRSGGGVTEPMESVDQFRARARAWIGANLEPRTSATPRTFDFGAERALQRRMFDAGFTGFMFPREYGGLGLTIDHQKAFFEEAAGYFTPSYFAVSIGMLGATILDCGTEAQKQRHLPAILRADEIFVQLLSEPSGGSDLAGALTRATLDGDTWVINGSKIWTSGGDVATHGLMLARTDWDVPKHRGLSMLIVPLGDHPGVTIEPITQVNGEADFCQEFFDDVAVPADNLLGAENEGWAVAQRLLLNERNTTAGIGIGHGYMANLSGSVRGDATIGERLQRLLDIAARRGADRDPVVRRLIGRTCVDLVAHEFARTRIMTGQGSGALDGPWGSLLKLGEGMDSPAVTADALAIAGSRGVIWTDEEPGGEQGEAWLSARGISIGGGSNEMQRNIVSERLLGLPRELDPSRELPFNEIQERRRQARRASADPGGANR
jgi:alkylation response protein AidB-like acyl-CoA dehydrogenase